MKERPILFSAPMVRAILEGRKTQTRRVVSLKGGWEVGPNYAGECWPVRKRKNTLERMPCPYGQPGDRLWVRESFRLCAEADGVKPRDTDAAYRVWYQADAPHQPGAGKLRPGMFLPRWASRITLEVTDVRVERLQDISEQDAIAEGVRIVTKDERVRKYCVYDRGDMSSTPWADMPRNAVPAFQSYLKNHGHMDWDANPWVWVVQFEVVK